LALLGGAATLGCNSSEPTHARIETLRIGVLPGESRVVLKEQFSPLVEYLEQELAIPCQLVLHGSYEEMQLAFENEQLDLAWFGGYTFVNANRSCNAVALVSRERDFRFTSYFLVRPDDRAAELADFRGKRFAFGSRLSTSGHLMPRRSLQGWKIDPEVFFGEVRYTGAHDETAFAIRDDDCDVGVASSAAIDAMFTAGQLADDDVFILKETPPYVDYVWACQCNIPAAYRTKVRDAFLKLDETNPAHAEILRQLRAEFFVPVHNEDFNELQSLVDELALGEIMK
jgi:phosphonate transport system substrate-binding protein